MVRRKQFILISSLIILASMVLSACGGVNIAKGFKSKDPNTFVTLTFGNVDTLDPALAYDTASGGIIMQVYDNLLFYKRDSITELVPQLATEVPSIKNGDISADGKTYTFKIRTGVKFHNGDTMTPDDVAFTFQRGILSGGSISPQWLFTEPVLGSTANNDITDQLDPDGSKGLLDNRDGVKAEDPAALKAVCEKVTSAIVADDTAGTVTFKLAQSWGPFLVTFANMWGGVQDKAWSGANGGWNGDCATWQNFYAPTSDEQNKNLIGKGENGTGPYMLKEWGDKQMTMVANPNYWLKTPLWSGGPSGVAKIQTVIIKEIDEFATRLATFQAGDGDYVVPGGAADWTQLDTLEGATCDAAGKCTIDHADRQAVRYVKQPVANRTDAFFNFNINTEGGNTFIGSGKLDGNGVPADFFSDIHVRKAFAYCFDWDTYITDVYKGEAVQSLEIPLPGMPGYDENAPHYTMDLTKAADEFKASTLKSADGKSVWDVGFRVQMLYNQGNLNRQTIAEILAANLAQINPKFLVETLGLPWPAYLAAQRAHQIPIMTGGWQEDIHDPNDWYQPYTVGAYGGRQGLPKDLIAQFTPLLNQGAALTDPDARTAVYKQLNQLYYDQAVGAPIVLQTAHGFQQNWVNGVVRNPEFPGIYYYPISKTGGKDKTTFTYATIGDALTMDPAWAYDTASGEIIQNVYETLIFYDGEQPAKFVPMLADKWDVSTDGKTYTFHLHPGVKFSNGDPMTASDVAYSFERGLLQGGTASP
ncbi:MAG: ABC transporter substrate-binding protein, partial [Anaerolineales bacterium]